MDDYIKMPLFILVNDNTLLFDRKCLTCGQVFSSPQGLKNHQTMTSNPGCKRTGQNRKRAKQIQDKLLHQESFQHRRIPKDHPSVFEQHIKGVPFCKDVKQKSLNLYQW